MSWLFNPSGWADSYGPHSYDFQHIANDIQFPGGDVAYGGNYIRTVGAVQYQAATLPGTAFTVTGGSWSGGYATLTVGTHKMVAGQLITVAGITPSGYNATTVPITSTGSTTISYAAASNPGSWSSGGTVTVGGTLAPGMFAIDGYGAPQIYFAGAWSAISALSQTPWASDINGANHNLLACASITLIPGSLPANGAGKIAVDGSNKFWVNNGSAWVAAGLQDTGANGIVKRTGVNATAAATSSDVYMPGNLIAAGDLPAFLPSGSSHAKGAVPDPGSSAGSTRFLREDATWAVPAGGSGGGLGDPGSNGLVYRNGYDTTRVATSADVYTPGSLIAISDLPAMSGSGPGHSPGLVPDPGGSAGSSRYLCENGAFSIPAGTAIQGRAVASTAPTDTQVLAWNASLSQWAPTAAGGASANASQLQGYNISATAPQTNQVLTWNGSVWVPEAGGSSAANVFVVENYTFTLTAASLGGVSLSIGSNTVTLSGACPLGLNGNDTGHWVYINNGTGTAEAVQISGGTARSGVTGGTLTFSCSNTHSGAWTITSAFGGVPEAVNIAAAAFPYSNAKILLTYAYGYNCYAPCLVPVAMDFDGGLAQINLKTTTGVAFQVEASGCKFTRLNVWSPAVGGQVSGSAAIKIGVNGSVTDTWVENSEFWQLYDCIVGINAQRIRATGNYFSNFSHTAILAGNTLAHDFEMLKASGNSYFNMNLSAPALADIYITQGWIDLCGEDSTHYTSSQAQYHVYVNRPLSTGGDRIFGCHFGYFTTAGIYFAASAYQQYTTITGNVIHNEDVTATSKGIVVGTNFDGVTISDNTIQGAGSNVFTGIDVTGALRPTLGYNSITTLYSTPCTTVAGASGQWTSMSLATGWNAQVGSYVPAYMRRGDGRVEFCGQANIASFPGASSIIATLSFVPTADLGGALQAYDTTAAATVPGFWGLDTGGNLKVFSSCPAGHGLVIGLDGVIARLS